MKVFVTIEVRFDRTPDGAVWSSSWADYAFWRRYLDVFEEVRVIARVRPVESPLRNSSRADGPNVSFAAMPYYIGPWQFARRYLALRRAARNAVDSPGAIILRVPGPISTLIEKPARAAGRAYAVEVVGDPRGVFQPGGVPTRLRRFFLWLTPRQLRRQCANACASAYVTSHHLQRSYPAAANTYSIGCSDIDLASDAFLDAPRTFNAASAPRTALVVGSLETLYKAQDILIAAVAQCRAAGFQFRLNIVGDGRLRAQLEELARSHGVGEQIRFLGKLPPGAAVREELDECDLFVLPSRQEGLPRALLEAMARALPCVATDVGGIPELLSADELVPAGDAAALAAKLREVLTDPQRLSRLSAENLDKAREFRREILLPRRREFYEIVKQIESRRQ